MKANPARHHDRFLFGFFMQGVGSAKAAVFFQLQLVRNSALVFCGGVVALLAVFAGKSDDVSHENDLDLKQSKNCRRAHQPGGSLHDSFLTGRRTASSPSSR
jgi:hypothetical protein